MQPFPSIVTLPRNAGKKPLWLKYADCLCTQHNCKLGERKGTRQTRRFHIKVATPGWPIKVESLALELSYLVPGMTGTAKDRGSHKIGKKKRLLHPITLTESNPAIQEWVSLGREKCSHWEEVALHLGSLNCSRWFSGKISDCSCQSQWLSMRWVKVHSTPFVLPAIGGKKKYNHGSLPVITCQQQIFYRVMDLRPE